MDTLNDTTAREANLIAETRNAARAFNACASALRNAERNLRNAERNASVDYHWRRMVIESTESQERAEERLASVALAAYVACRENGTLNEACERIARDAKLARLTGDEEGESAMALTLWSIHPDLCNLLA